METMSRTILVVDDESDIREILCFNLEQVGYRCLQAKCGREALHVVRHESVDLVLLDIMMPGMSGMEVAEQLRAMPNGPAIVFLTALGEEPDILKGFELGADDYIPKPFSLKQVRARIAAVLRRTSRPDNSAVQATDKTISFGTLVLFDALKTATLDGQTLSLTRMEYELLRFMMQHPHVIYSRTDILRNVWPDDGMVLDRTVDVTITRLRKKIGVYKENLKAKTGYGYYWEK